MYPIIMRSMSQALGVLWSPRERHILSQQVTLIFAFLSPKVHKFGSASLYKYKITFQKISPKTQITELYWDVLLYSDPGFALNIGMAKTSV